MLLFPELGRPWPVPGEQLGEVRAKHAELVAPGVAPDPEVKAALLLVVTAVAPKLACMLQPRCRSGSGPLLLVAIPAESPGGGGALVSRAARTRLMRQVDGRCCDSLR